MSGAHGPRARRAFAVGLVIGLLLFLVLIGSTLGFTSSGSSRAVVRTLGDHACHDLCLSALAEATVTLNDGLRSGDTVAGLRLGEALRRQFPFKEVQLPTPAAQELARRLHPGLKLESVTLRPVSRSAPGQEDPLVGTVELSVKASGKVNGVWTGLRLAQRLPFRVRCAQFAQSGHRGTYIRFHWGEAFLAAHPIATVVEPL